MNSSSSSAHLEKPAEESLARRLEHHCAAAEEFLANERLRMETIEADMFDALSALSQRLVGAEPGAIATGHSEWDLEQRAQQIDEAARQLEAMRADLESGQSKDEAELRRVADERDRLTETCRELEQRLSEFGTGSAVAAPSDEGIQTELDDSKRRYELATDEIVELKRQLADLQDQRRAVEASSPSPASEDDGGALDWESQKKRMLAELDGEDGLATPPTSDSTSPATSTSDGSRGVEDVVAAKEREIDCLKARLESQDDSDANGNDDAVNEALDADELIQQERERLLAMQEEIREKQRVAEVEIALERAQLARARAEMEEQLARQADNNNGDATDSDGKRGAESQKPGGKWLARLGLSGE